jgi:uracil-DNA glycosylase
LLNATLTVRAGAARSHYGKGWERFTDAVVEKLMEKQSPIVFMLWGRSAQEKLQQIEKRGKTAHQILTAAHPSPLSAHAGFFGCKHFSQANAFLKNCGRAPIDWQ